MRNRDRTEAEKIAAMALDWLISESDLFSVFLGSSGMAVEEIPNLVEETDFLVGVLDFLTMDDAWVLAFCEARNVTTEKPIWAQAVLSGRAGTHWT